MLRVLSGLVLGAAVFAIVWFSSATVLVFVALGVCILAFHEYAVLMRRIGADIPTLPALAATMAALTVVPFPYPPAEATISIGLAAIVAGAMARSVRGTSASGREAPAFRPAMHGAAAGALAVVYLGLSLGALVGVHVFGGRGAVILLIATVVISDTAQYYSGRLLGRHALAPRISPKKTIEGAVGGFVAAPVFLYFAGPYMIAAAAPVGIALLGIPLVAVGIVGDLFESMLKRAADTKDSSALIPGHGGVLDRIDALLLAAPVFYLYVRWL